MALAGPRDAMVRVAILGLGSIGGSIALDLFRVHEVRGFDPDPASCAAAAAAGIPVCGTPEQALAGAELAVFCAPLGRLPALVEALAPHVDAGAIVTDVGGVKSPVVKAGRRLLPGAFVGGHPMAGSTGHGFVAARTGLFVDAPWALTPGGRDEQEAAARVRQVLAPTGARFFECDPESHDRAVAFTSHVPYLMSVAIARAARGARDEGLTEVSELVGPGFRDVTRLAMTPVQLGHDMAFENRDAVLAALAALRHQIAQAEILLQNDLESAFATWSEGAATWRAALSLPQ